MKLFFAILMGLALPASAATYHVTKAGSDAADGSVGTPWLTIQKAANTVVGGDLVLVGAGAYAEIVTETTSGTAGNWIVYRTNGAVSVSQFKVNGEFVELDGFQLTGTGVTIYQGVMDVNSHNVIARNLTITNLAADIYGVLINSAVTNLYVDGCRLGDCNYPHVSLEGGNHTITNCVWTGASGWDAIRLLCSNSKVVDNTLTNFTGSVDTYAITHGDFIQTFSNGGEIATNNLIEGNFLRNLYYMQIGNFDDEALGNVNDWTWRNNIFIGPTMAANVYAPGFKWHNNVFFRCTTNTGHVLDFKGTALRNYGHNAEVYNNIFFECGANPASASQGFYTFAAGVTNLSTNYNLVIGTGAGTSKTGFGELSGINGSDPLFVSAGGQDPSDSSLQSGSPCIGAGMNLNASFTTDFVGTVRGTIWDIGAYEFIPSIPTFNGLRFGPGVSTGGRVTIGQ